MIARSVRVVIDNEIVVLPRQQEGEAKCRVKEWIEHRHEVTNFRESSVRGLVKNSKQNA